MSKRDRDRLDPFQRGDLEEVADEIYGKPAPFLDAGRIVAVSTNIDAIWADVKQPRRAVPASIRLHWNGNPVDVAEMLNQWHIIAGKTAVVDVYAILQGNGEGFEVENAPAIFTGYLELLRLAASIRKEGLINPISIVEFSGRNVIETGERRWLAYHMLRQYMGDEWAKIPARKSEERDYVWRQAAENTARRELNAIGMARQLALLIMETRRGIEGQSYNDFDELVIAGGCDRKFYAQIANGNVHRVPRGMGERIQGAMNLSEKRLADYRKLLKLTEDEVVNDALWIRGDVGDWPEFTLREVVSTLPDGKVREIVTRENWTLGDLREAMEGAKNQAPSPPLPTGISFGHPQGEGGQDVPPTPSTEFQILDKVRTPGGHIGTVVRVNGRLLDVQTVNGLKAYLAEHLTLVSRAREEEQETPPQPLPTSQAHGEGQRNARIPVQRINLDDYPDVMALGAWIERYKALKKVRGADELLFTQTAYGAVALREDAKKAFGIGMDMAHEYENTEHGMAFFLKDLSGLDEFAKRCSVAIYKDYANQPAVNTFWVKHVMNKKAAVPTVKMSETGKEIPVLDGIPVGNAVRIDHNGKIGQLLGVSYKDDEEPGYMVRVDGKTEETWREALTDLGMSYADWVKPSPPTIPQGGNETGTDKADSLILPDDHDYVIGYGSAEWQFLNAMREAARLLEDHDTEKAMTELIQMTSTEARRWEGKGGIRMLLDGYSDHMLQVLAGWQEVRLQNVLHQIETAGQDA